MGRPDVERVLRQLEGQPTRAQLLNTLVEVRKRIISTRPGLEEFVRLGGLTLLTELLKQPQPGDVFNVLLSVLGNCTARPAGRQHFTQHGGLHAVLNVLQLVADQEVANRCCRTLANLAQEPALCRTLHQEDTLELVESLLAADQQPPPPDELRTTVFRLWRLLGDRDSHRRRLLRTECLVTVAGSLGSQNKQLAREALRTLEHFAAHAARETGAQMQQSAEAMPALLGLCGADVDSSIGGTTEDSGGAIVQEESGASDAGSSAERPPPPLQDPELAASALRLTMTLARESSLRPTLGQLGFLQLLWQSIRGAVAGEAADSQSEAAEQRRGRPDVPGSDATAGSGGQQTEDSLRLRQETARPQAGGTQTEDSLRLRREAARPQAGGTQTEDSLRLRREAARPQAGGTQTEDSLRLRREAARPQAGGTQTEEAASSDTASVTSVISTAADRSSLISALCLFCWESVNRARFRSLGYLPWLVRLLGSTDEPESLRRRVLHALFQFVYDEAGFAQMKRAGLIAVLVSRLETLVGGWRRDGETDRHRRADRHSSVSPASSDASDSDGSNYRADSPTYRQVEREIESYLQQVRRFDPPAERLFKSFSPTDSLASSPLRSPDVSPPSWRFSAPSPGSASPGGSSAGSQFSPPVSPGSSQFSPPVSPGSWQFSPPVSPGASGPLSPPLFPGSSRFSPPVSPAAAGPVSPLEYRREGQWSPQVSPGGGGALPTSESPGDREFSPQVSSGTFESRSPSESSTPSTRRMHQRSPELHSPGGGGSARPSKRRRLYSAEVSRESTRRGEEQSWLLLLLSRESQSERPDRQLPGAASCRALIDYLRLAPQPQPRAARILARLGRNPRCFRPLVCQRLAWQCVSSLSTEQAEPALAALRSVAHSGYGQGVLESLMELGGDRATAAVTTAAIVVSLQTSLRRLLLRQRGLDLLLDELVSDADERVGPAAGALAALCRHLSPKDPPPPSTTTATTTAAAAGERNNPTAQCQYMSDQLPQDLTLVLSDGEVAARRDRLAAGSPVLAALLTGGFREATIQRVPLGELERAVAAPLVHLAYGCGAGCRLMARLPARLWLPLLAAADRFLLTEAAETLGGRVLAARRPEKLAALYRAARSQPLALDGAADWRLGLLLLRRLLATGPRRAINPLRMLLKDERQALLADLRTVVTKLLEPTVA